MKQRSNSSLTRAVQVDLVGMSARQRGQQGLACRSTWQGSRMLQQHRQRQLVTLTRKCGGASVFCSSLRATSPERVFMATSAAWKASLLVNPVDLEPVSRTSSGTFWPGIAAAIKCNNSSTLKGTLIALSTLAPQYLLTQSSWQANQHRIKPQSYSQTCGNPSSAVSEQDVASSALSRSGSSDLLQGSSEFAAHAEVLDMLISLLENAAGDLALLLAASVYSCISSFRGSVPPQAVTAHHLRVMTASLLSVDNTPAITSGHATQVYLLASLQRLMTAVPQARLHLVSVFTVPKLLFLAGLGHQSNAQTDISAVANQQGHSVAVGIHAQASQMLTKMSLGLLSQLVMTNAAADAFVVQQMLEADAVPMLVGMLGSQPAAADLLCFMATQQQCKEAFLGSKALGSLVDCLHASTSSGTAAQKGGQKAAGVLWRVATDCDKAKLEVAKAGAVAPAVAMLKAACQDLTVSPAATEAAYLVAVLAEHHCTHQLITAQGSIAALLQVMHTAGQVHTTSWTLDLVSGSTAQQARHSKGSLCTAPCSGRAAGPLAASAEASVASMTHSVSDVMSVRMLDAEGESKALESASSKEECKQDQSAHQGDDSPPASSAASAESVSHSMHQTGHQDRIDSRDTGVCSDSNSDGERHQATAGASGGNQEVSSGYTDTGRGSVSVGQHDGDGDEGVSSSSIHSRLLRAARAAKAGSSGDAQNDGQRRQDADRHRGQAASLVRDRLLVAANAALASLAGNADTHFAMVNEGAAPALVAALQHGTVNAQALACSSFQAIAASDARHAAVFARAGAIPWLVALVSQWPSHACGRNAASALREILQDSAYQTEACGCGLIAALIAMLKAEDSDCQAAAAALLHVLAAATQISSFFSSARVGPECSYDLRHLWSRQLRKKAISRAGGIAPLAAVLAGQSAEGSMHAAQTLLYMAKLPDLKVLIVQGGAVPNVVQHLSSSFPGCSCQTPCAKPGPCYCTCSKAAAARLLGRLCSDQVAQMQLLAYNPVAALLNMITAGCKHTVQYHDYNGNELEQECEKSRWIKESAAEYALIKIACHCDEEFREQILKACIGQAWMGHEVAVGSMLF